MAPVFGPTSTATPEIHTLADTLSPLAVSYLNTEFRTFDAVSFIIQTNMFQGRNYILKIHISDDVEGYIHLKTFVAPPANNRHPVITGIKESQTLTSPIENFN